MSTLKFPPLVAALMLLSACGGGGGGAAPPPVQNTPSGSQARSMVAVELGSVQSQNTMLQFLMAALPVPQGALFAVNGLCPGGGVAVPIYNDNDHSNSVSANDTYRINYANCVDGKGDTYASGYMDVAVTGAGTSFPDFSTGNGVFTSDWSLSETASFHDLVIRDGMTGVTENDNGTVTANLSNNMATSTYHSSISSDGLTSADFSGNGTYLHYYNLWLDYSVNTATLNYSLKHDFMADITAGNATSRLIYTNEPAFSGRATSLSHLFTPPTAGGLHIIWAGYKEVTAVAQPDGLNALVDIVGGGSPASLVAWSSLGLN